VNLYRFFILTFIPIISYSQKKVLSFNIGINKEYKLFNNIDDKFLNENLCLFGRLGLFEFNKNNIGSNIGFGLMYDGANMKKNVADNILEPIEFLNRTKCDNTNIHIGPSIEFKKKSLPLCLKIMSFYTFVSKNKFTETFIPKNPIQYGYDSSRFSAFTNGFDAKGFCVQASLSYLLNLQKIVGEFGNDLFLEFGISPTYRYAHLPIKYVNVTNTSSLGEINSITQNYSSIGISIFVFVNFRDDLDKY
jgi:hypothetical protein